MNRSLSATETRNKVIEDLKKLPKGTKLTKKQIGELEKNLDAVLEKSLPGKVKSKRVQDIVDLLKNDLRFKHLDQVQGAKQKINDALAKYGLKL